MKFKVSRVSVLWAVEHPEDDMPPCEGAIKEPYVRVDEWMVSDPSQLPGTLATTWYSQGRNHRVEHGHIKRNFDDEAWFIEIATLQDLMTLIERHGEATIGTSIWNPSIMEIEIE